MKLIKPSYDIWIQQAGLEGVYKQIEKAARICYKSENNIAENSAKDFVDRLINLGHGAMLEHGTVYLYIDGEDSLYWDFKHRYDHNKYSICNTINGVAYISSNLRVLVENDWIEDLNYICKPTEFHEKRITVKFILSRSIAQEFTRHRVFSFAMESQRYCNYSKDKFGNEVTFIIPEWLDWDEQIIHSGDFEDSGSGSEDSYLFISSLLHSEESYFNLLFEGWKPQQAREVLPNACKTELVMTGFISQWKEFFKLRDDSRAHPQARELAKPLHEEFIARGYITE